MPSNTIVLATFALAVVALVVHTRVKRGRRLLVLRDRARRRRRGTTAKSAMMTECGEPRRSSSRSA